VAHARQSIRVAQPCCGSRPKTRDWSRRPPFPPAVRAVVACRSDAGTPPTRLRWMMRWRARRPIGTHRCSGSTARPTWPLRPRLPEPRRLSPVSFPVGPRADALPAIRALLVRARLPGRASAHVGQHRLAALPAWLLCPETGDSALLKDLA
jgi:hypothetical protein